MEKIIPNALKRRYQLLIAKKSDGSYKLTDKEKLFMKDYQSKYK